MDVVAALGVFVGSVIVFVCVPNSRFMALSADGFSLSESPPFEAFRIGEVERLVGCIKSCEATRSTFQDAVLVVAFGVFRLVVPVFPLRVLLGSGVNLLVCIR